MKKLKPVRPGQPITAALMNQLIEGYNQLQGLAVAAPLQMMHLPGGIQLGINQNLAKQSLFEITDLAGTTPGDGSDPQDVYYWNAKQITLAGDGGYTIPSGATTHLLYDPLRVLAGRNLAKWHPAYLNSHTGRWEILPGYVGAKWAKTIERWNVGNHPYVSCNPCRNAQGDGVDTSQTIAVSLPKLAGRDPNVRAGDIIAYTQVGDGTTQVSNLCISNYLDDKVGTIKIWTGLIAAIPPGWALADGTANSIANGGSGRNLTARFLVGYQSGHANYFQIGQTGGTDTHTHALGALAGGTGFASSASGYNTDSKDHRPPWYVVAFIERIV